MIKRITAAGCYLVLPAMLFISWQTGKGKKASRSAGAKLYVKYACKSCHGDKGVGVGDLRKAGQKYTDEQLVTYISNPKQFGNTKMPAFAGVIAEADFKPLIEYVKLLGQLSVKPSSHK
jgi:mono/diheme cytochrome c family protein